MDNDARNGLSRLYAIADAGTWGLDRLPDLVESWSNSGVDCIQIRAKGATEAELFAVAQRCSERLRGSATALWVNDSVAVARAVGATGVHLGQDDQSPGRARELLDDGQLIGRSTHSGEQLAAAQADPAVDVVALGPIFPTKSKEDSAPVVGLELLEEVCGLFSKPIVGIGGIGEADFCSVLSAGAESVAVIGALKEVGAVDRLLALASAFERGGKHESVDP